MGLALPAAGLSAQEPVRIVYVDMQRLIDSAPQVVQGRARLAREFAEADARLKLDQQRLAELEAALRQSPDADPSDPGEQALEADALRRSIERSQQRLREELAARVQQETDRAWPLIEEAVASYAREQGFDLVLQGPVLYASGRIDITDRVLERLRGTGNQSLP
jgi:outer membrane protein